MLCKEYNDSLLYTRNSNKKIDTQRENYDNNNYNDNTIRYYNIMVFLYVFTKKNPGLITASTLR